MRRLKSVDDREGAPPANPVSADGKLLFTDEQWLACQKEKKSKRARLRPRIVTDNCARRAVTAVEKREVVAAGNAR
jgi:hypothetical protein